MNQHNMKATHGITPHNVLKFNFLETINKYFLANTADEVALQEKGSLSEKVDAIYSVVAECGMMLLWRGGSASLISHEPTVSCFHGGHT